jgi:NRPS condensation-like uncharacterized protein
MAYKINVPMWDKMQVFCKHIADHQIRLILNFDRLLNEEALRNAIILTLKNNQIAYASYKEGKNDAFWISSELDIEKVYFYYECQETESIVQETIIKQLDTFKGPQLTISLIRSDVDILIVNCNHSVSDAAGVKEFVYQLAENYSVLSQNKTVPQQEYTPSRSLKLLSVKLSIKERLSIVKTMLSNKKTAPSFQKQVGLDLLQNPAFETYTIEPYNFEKIKGFGKKYSASVNDVLLTIYFYALKKILKNSNKTNRLQYTSDLRGYLENVNHDTLSNFSAIHNIDIDNSIDDFTGLLKEIVSITKARKHLNYDLADFPMMAFLFKLMPYKKIKSVFHKEFEKIKTGKTIAPPSLTNMGIIEEAKLAFDKIIPVRANMLGGINHPSLLQLAVSTYMKHLTLSIGSYYCGENNILISNSIKELKKTIDEEVVQSPVAQYT